MLVHCRETALKLFDDLSADGRFVPAFPPELDIVVWAVSANTNPESSQAARDYFVAAAKNNVHLALAELPSHFFWPEQGENNVACLRSVVMKTTNVSRFC